jgi:sorbitol-specific phosphotransferase system component IIC
MFKNLVACLLIISLLSGMQSCCTMIGYEIGKSMDEKSKPEVYVAASDTSLTTTSVATTDTIEVKKSNYKTIFATIGVLADLSLVFVGVLLTNPIHSNIGGGF